MEQRPPDDPPQQTNIIVLVAVVLFVVGCTWLLIKFHQESAMQDCVLAHHRNCVPLDTTR